jgi:hypothetical protein
MKRNYDALRMTREGGKRDVLVIYPETAQRIHTYCDAAGRRRSGSSGPPQDIGGPMPAVWHAAGRSGLSTPPRVVEAFFKNQRSVLQAATAHTAQALTAPERTIPVTPMDSAAASAASAAPAV